VRCLERGVEVSIGYGIDDGKDAFERDQEAEQSLLRLAEQRSNLTVTRLGDTHAKVLVCDTRYVIVTSFNWLSFRGDPNRPFRDERGTLVAVPSEVDRIYNEYQGRIAAG
jgi:phosphatidylserine/phosphatidylglycerophosphate/cardiolipin synthase-like enzyme